MRSMNRPTLALALALVACRSTSTEVSPGATTAPTALTIPSAASSAALPSTATAVATVGAPPTTPPPVAAAEDACVTAADCAWGEIGGEIRSSKDCQCLFGCPSLPLSKQTVERRNADHMRLCKPGFNGEGRRCPIDDCAMPGPLACVAGHCTGKR